VTGIVKTTSNSPKSCFPDTANLEYYSVKKEVNQKLKTNNSSLQSAVIPLTIAAAR